MSRTDQIAEAADLLDAELGDEVMWEFSVIRGTGHALSPDGPAVSVTLIWATGKDSPKTAQVWALDRTSFLAAARAAIGKYRKRRETA